MVAVDGGGDGANTKRPTTNFSANINTPRVMEFSQI